jgi:hypothetical protein
MSGFDRFLEDAAHGFMRTQGEPDPNAHLTREVLSDYRSRRVSASDKERIQDHLVACRECGNALLDLIAQNPALPWWKRAASSFVWVGRQPVPAVLSLAVIALGFWNAILLSSRPPEVEPQIQAPVAELFAGPSRGQSEAAKEIPLAPDMWIFTLVLHVPEPAPGAKFDLHLVNAEGTVLWQAKNIRPDTDSSITLSIPRPTIGQARELRIRLLESGKRSTAAVYAVRLAAP